MKTIVLLGGLCLLAGFHQPASFEASAGEGGGNRIYFDGSPRQKGYDCTACHTEPAGLVTAEVTVTPASTGAYQPGVIYTIAVALRGEHLGQATANNQNGFVAELVDDSGAPAGTLATLDEDLVETIDDGAVIAGEGKDLTTWSFTWTAPTAGRGAVTLHAGLVDGNGADSAAVPQNDPGGDDVAVTRLRMCEGTAGCAGPASPVPTESKAAGCAVGGDASPLVGALALVLMSAVRRRAALLLALGGCFAPTTPAECPDHVCGNPVNGDAGDAGSSCPESWVCSPWQAAAGSDQATRTCVDKNNTGTTVCMPATAATLPPLDLEFYKCQVQPILQRGCGQLACHGTETGHPFRLYTRGRLRNDQIVNAVSSCLDTGQMVNLKMRATGTVMCEGWLPHTAEEWQKNFDSARSFMIGVASPGDSLLLREPARGGLPHAQVKLFAAGDPDYQTIETWLGGARQGATCDTGKN